MKTFESGEKVVWTETGRSGTVEKQFLDGYVSLMFEDGHPAELPASQLQLSKKNGARPRHATKSHR